MTSIRSGPDLSGPGRREITGPVILRSLPIQFSETEPTRPRKPPEGDPPRVARADQPGALSGSQCPRGAAGQVLSDSGLRNLAERQAPSRTSGPLLHARSGEGARSRG